jgi:ABC-type hemin transport system ATPase subunit
MHGALRDAGVMVLLVTHNLNLAARYARSYAPEQLVE